MSVNVESTRLEWERAYRDLEDVARDPAGRERLQSEVAVMSAALRRRLGGSFTLSELVDAYADADRWAHEVLAEQGSASGWTRTLTLVEGAAFHLYSRGAVDYSP